MYPLTSIIILTKNNIQFTERCLLSIWEQLNPNHTPFEIIIADENSTDGTREMCELYRGKVTYLNLPEFDSFAKRNNEAAKHTKGEFLWFLNNDTELLNNNLHFMLQHFSNPEVGMVGNMHLFPNRSLNHMGIAFDQDLQPQHIFPHENPDLPYINHPREIDVVTAASVIVRRSVFEEVGGFDESYGWGYEDVDLCLKIREAEYKIICDNQARLIHFGQSTHGRTDRDKENYEIFKKRWHDKIKPNLAEIYAEKEAFLNSHRSAKQLLKSSASKAKNLPLYVFKKLNSKRPQATTPASNIYLYKSPQFTAFTDIAEQIEENVTQDHIVIDDVSKLYNVANPPSEGAMLLTTTHFSKEYLVDAPEWVREYRSYDVNYERTDYSRQDYWTEYLKDAKFHILASSQYCMDFLTKSGVDKEKISIVPHGYNKNLLDHDFDQSQPNEKVTFLVIINTNDEVRYGTDRLAEALEILAKQDPEFVKNIKLIIKNYGGKDSQHYFLTKEYQRILKTGVEIEYESRFLTKDDLAKLYYRADAFIAPFRGEGFGMKILDAAIAGMPIICPAYGGPLDYLKDAEHISVDYKMVPVGWGIDYFSLFLDETYIWADVVSSDLANKLKSTVNNIAKHKEAAIAKRDKLRDKYSYKTIWDQVYELDQKLQQKQEVKGEFDFYTADIVKDLKTKAHDGSSQNSTSLIINTNRPENLDAFFTHLDTTFNGSKELNEILVIDDASDTEDTEFLDKFSHLPIRYIKYSKWGGSGFAREIGLRYARHDHIIIIGDDIKPMPGFFAHHRKAYEQNEGPYLLMGHVEWDKDVRNVPITMFATKITNFQFGYEEIRNNKDIDYKHVYTSNLSFRKSDIIAAQLHFELGMILFEDTIWARELEKKNFEIQYSRNAYALHSHKVKNSWWHWLTDRSRVIGNYNVPVYTANYSLDEEISKTGKIIQTMSAYYMSHSYSELKDLAAAFDIRAKEFADSYERLVEIEQNIGYSQPLRNRIYELCGQAVVLYRLYGIGQSLTASDEAAKALAFLSFNQQFQSQQGPFGNSLKEALRYSLYLSRQRFPIIFEGIYRVGKIFKPN